MARESICQYGDCAEYDTKISINYEGEERPRFCCTEHAALWLLARGSLGGSRNSEYMKIEPLILDLHKRRANRAA